MAEQNMPRIGEVVQFPSREMFATGGVYFLHHKGEVVYVGESVNMWARIGRHMTDGQKIFDAVSCLPCKGRIAKERYYIALLLPKYNNCCHTKAYRQGGADRFLAATRKVRRKSKQAQAA